MTLAARDSLHLIILPTEQCNFRCTYCYESFKLKRMRKETVSALKKFIAHEVPKLRHLELAWFGGEPLLEPALVLDIARHAADCCRASGRCTLSGNITTNAYHLDVALAGRLIECHQSTFHVTLDGFRETHDKTRKLANDGATFDMIWNNLLRLRDSALDFRVDLRLHLFERNLPEMSALMPHLVREFGADERFHPYLAPIANYGGGGAAALGVLSEAARTHAAQQTGYDQTPWGGRARPMNPVQAGYVCYASQPRSFAIRPDGQVVKCTHALDAPQNLVGFLDPGGRLVVSPEALRTWVRGHISGNAGELACPLKNLPSQANAPYPVDISRLFQKSKAAATEITP